MKAAFVMLAVVLLLTGCSHPPKDPFVGTWNDPTGHRVVVTRQGSDYVAVAYWGGGKKERLDFFREGNRLIGYTEFRLPGEPMGGMAVPPPTAELNRASGQLYFSLFGRNAKLSKVSDDTATPTAWP